MPKGTGFGPQIIMNKLFKIVLMFAVSTSFASAIYADSSPKVIYHGLSKWYNREDYKKQLGSSSGLKALYEQDIRRFFWDSEIKPTLLFVSETKTKKKSGGIRVGGGSGSTKKKGYYSFAGASWKRSGIERMWQEIYGERNAFYSGKDVDFRKKIYAKQKPKARIFAMIRKEGSSYWLQGKDFEKIKERKTEKPAPVSPTEQARELWIEGRNHMGDNNYEEAVKCFEQAKKKDPGYSPPYYRLGLCYEKIGDTEKSLEHYNKYLAFIEGKSGKESIRKEVQESIDRLEFSERELTNQE